MNKKAVLIVLDSVGCGELPDADIFGDKGTNTLANTAKATKGLNLPNMAKMGLGNITDILGVEKTNNASGYFGKAKEKSSGKDTTSGHWEIAGIVSEKPFNTYPNGFPKETIEAIEKFSARKLVCNKPYSGTTILDDYGEHQMRTGDLIIYTSADSVLQIAAHEEIIPVEELYRICEKSLEICKELSPVARVIARPYIGTSKGNFKRTERRHDYSIAPTKESMLVRIKNAGLPVIGVGKISDIFAGVGITENRKSNIDNLDGINKTIKAIEEIKEGIVFTNLVDFDMVYGHRRDVEGYKDCLEEFDAYLPKIIEKLGCDDLLIITADHGCDPTHRGTDHTREHIPILAYGKKLKNNVNIGIRESFSDIAASIETYLLSNSALEGNFL